MTGPARVISLVRRQDRRERFQRWNADKGIEYRFFDAIDGRALDRAALHAEGLISSVDVELRDGAIGAALSFRALWRECIASGENMVILEDDCFVHRHLAGCLPRADAALAAGADIVYLGFNFDAILSIQPLPGKWAQFFLSREGPPFDEFSANYASADMAEAARPVPARSLWGMPGTVVSPKGAERLIRAVFPLRFGPDVQMYGEGRTIPAWSLDGWITAALQAGGLRAQVFFPPLVVNPNDVSESDASLDPAPAPPSQAAQPQNVRIAGSLSATLGFGWPKI